MDVLPLLTTYTNRQVIVNTYEDDELVARDGFFFDTIERSAVALTFLKDGKPCFIVSLQQYPHSRILSDFSGYFQLYSTEQNQKIELYFPAT
ncbi:hypothetical protein GGR02_001614 [Anoxybacillus voinovskiensis]|uniref:Uncharacterized protein n=1 Tax=Anoxybacteroides voinovskiense TaxID=230470 RepID=A0A840DKP7_9BACL|nr:MULTISPECIES: hypothetical protein [Anoxybacillus]MBB4073851.1 hypothetical protein [Anoxybacillus voinovskiensis]MCL6587335.1 hypothetical protein [Anoxybacillus sp.]GGJ66658.1 hypothetical protein GCM10008982_14900 [Anoxybacillus voinovskiensis]